MTQESQWERADRVLSEAPLVAEAALVPLGDAERPWLVARPDDAALRAGRFVNIREALRFRLETAAVSLPVGLRQRGITIARAPLPRTGQGAIDRVALRRELGPSPPSSWPLAPGTSDPLPEQWTAWLREAGVSDRLPEPPGREHSLEFDLGLDSLERMVLILTLADRFGVEVSDETVTRIYTLGDLERELPAPRSPARPSTAPPRAAVVLRGPRPPRAVRRWLRRRHLTWAVVRVCRAIAGPLARRRLRLTVRGLSRADWSARPLLIAQNHQTHMDAALLAASLPPAVHRDVRFLGFTGYFGQGLGRWVGELFGIHPISADAGALSGIRAGLAAVEAGRVVCVYPEGERTWDGTLRPFRRGIAWLAAESGARVVPAAITGAYQCWPRGRDLVPHGRVTVTFGAPIEPPPRSLSTAEEAAFLDRLRHEIGGLMREAGQDPDLGDPEVWADGPGASLARRDAGEVVSPG